MKLPVGSLLFLVLLTFTPLYSDSAFLYGKEVQQISEELNQFFPREENSDNEKLLFQYLEKKFSENNLIYTTLDYGESEQSYSFSKGYSTIIKGKSEKTLILAVPLDSEPGQSVRRNGTVNIATALELIKIFSSYQPPLSIEFLFLGAEKGDGSNYPIGSRFFLANNSLSEDTVVIYLDLSSPGDTILLKNSSDSDQTPFWLVRSLCDLFSDKGLDFSISSVESLVCQSGFEKPSPILKTYLDNEVQMIQLKSLSTDKSTIPDEQWINGFIETLLSFVLNQGDNFSNEWDRHYLTLEAGNKLYALNEKTGLLLLCSITAVLILTLLIKSRNLHLNLKRFRNHLWTFPLLLFLIFLYLFLSTLIIEEISSFRDYPDFWMQNPEFFLVFKISLSLLLYTGFLFLIRGINLSPSHHFYTYSAFTSVIISLFAVIIFNISFSYFFLWSLLSITLFMISRNRLLKIICIGLTPLPVLAAGYRIFSGQYINIEQYLILSRLSGNLFLTILIMPTLMLASSLSHFTHHYIRRRKAGVNIIVPVILIAITVFGLYRILTVKPFENELQPLDITEQINIGEKSRIIKINSPAPIGDINLSLDKQNLNLTDLGRSAQITAPLLSGLVSIEKKSSTFLDRISLTYTIKAEGRPDKILVKLTSQQPIIVYNSNFPSEMTSDGHSVLFRIGANPSIPLELKIILPRNLTPDMEVELEYRRFPYSFSISNRKFDLHKILFVKTTIPWEK